MQLQTGQIVNATVVRTEVYGIYLEYGRTRILVLIPETSWFPSSVSSCHEFTMVGKTHNVKIIGYDEANELYSGSIRQVHPEQDPWYCPNRFLVGTRWTGCVTMIIKGAEGPTAVMVEIEKGVAGLLRLQEADRIFAVGERLEVAITQCELNKQQLTLTLIR